MVEIFPPLRVASSPARLSCEIGASEEDSRGSQAECSAAVDGAPSISCDPVVLGPDPESTSVDVDVDVELSNPSRSGSCEPPKVCAL